MKAQMTPEQKEKQIRKEARATLLLFLICFLWNVGFAYGLSGTGARLFGLPVWWLVSTPGMFVIAVIGVVILLKKVFVNFDLEDTEEGGGVDE
ncbi:MAG: YhdT family protein [Clostridiales bacterium]|nr:YhdT family protein [Clostridiales bacterium]